MFGRRHHSEAIDEVARQEQIVLEAMKDLTDTGPDQLFLIAEGIDDDPSLSEFEQLQAGNPADQEAARRLLRGRDQSGIDLESPPTHVTRVK